VTRGDAREFSGYPRDDIDVGRAHERHSFQDRFASVTALPTAEASQRGRTVVVEGAPGVADEFYICLKSSADTYSWRQIIVG
jgi:hypothetical protein